MKNVNLPQANNLELVFKSLYDIGPDGISKYDLAKKYHLSDRQGAYYLDALLYLELVEKVRNKYFLTSSGVSVRLESADMTRERFCAFILKNSFLGNIYAYVKGIAEEEARLNYITSQVISNYELAHSTAKRRASSILSWFEWIDISSGCADANQ